MITPKQIQTAAIQRANRVTAQKTQERVKTEQNEVPDNDQELAISDKASMMNQLAEAPEPRLSGVQIASLQTAIRNGEYSIDFQGLADKLMQHPLLTKND